MLAYERKSFIFVLFLKSKRAHTSIRLLNIVNESCTIRLPDNTHHLSHTRSNYHSFKHSNTHTSMKAYTHTLTDIVGCILDCVTCSSTHITHRVWKHIKRSAVSVSTIRLYKWMVHLFHTALPIRVRAVHFVRVCLFHCQRSLNQIDQFWHVHIRTYTMAYKQIRIFYLWFGRQYCHTDWLLLLCRQSAILYQNVLWFQCLPIYHKFNECDRSPIIK